MTSPLANRGRKPKYSDELVASVRARWQARPTYKSLADELGCSIHTIRDMVNDSYAQRKKKRRMK